MALLRFFRMPKHQQYEYKPRYWDPKKEELQKRLQQIEEIKAGGTDGIKARISSGFRRGYSASQAGRRKEVMRSNMTLLGIIVALLVLSYMFLSVYLPRIVEAVESGGG